MSKSKPLVGLRGVRIATVLLLGLLQACAEVKPTGIEEPSVASSDEAIVATTTVIFQDGTNGYVGTRDTYLNQNSGNANFGARTTLYVDGDDPTRTGRDLSALLYFDVSSIPSNAVVTSATLTLHVTDPSIMEYPIYGLNRRWDEFQVTWVRALRGANWQTVGAKGALDRDSSVLGAFAAPATGSTTVELGALGIAKLQSWVTTPGNNYGLIIANPTNTDKLAFLSHEDGSVSRRPKLSVTYTVTTPDCIAPGCCTTDTACNDGNACTTDVCVAGVCDYATITGCCNSVSDCANDGNPCAIPSCVDGVCSYPIIAGCCLVDSECADTNACTEDACVANACQHDAVSGCCNEDTDCGDDNDCTEDSCSNNVCGHSVVAGCCVSDADCADTNACTADTCADNQCTYSVLAGCCASDSECNDFDPCTTDRCFDAACTYALIAGGACGCTVDADCNDTMDCTSDRCVAGTCSNVESYPGACGCQTDAGCDDENPCTVDACTNAACSNVVADCNDGNPSTTDECVDGYCSHSVQVPITKTFRNGEDSYTGASDTKIAQYYPSTNYDTATVLVVDGDEPSGGGNDVSTLIRWDNVQIPPDATVTQASITVYIGGGTNSASATAYSIYAMNRPWATAGATWDVADSTNAWSMSGASGSLDREPVAIGATPISVSGSATINLNATGIAKVQSWVNNPTTNYGVIFASSTNTDGLSLYSSEFTTVSYRPMLSVTYSGRQTTTDPVAITAAGNAPRFGFFVYSDSHVDVATNPVFTTALEQMNDLKNADGAPPIVAAISLGDHTENGTDASWDVHTALTETYWDAAASNFGGTLPRYLAVPGNHDVLDSNNWYVYWSEHLPGQASVGGNSSSAGVYYSFSHENALFVGLDTNKATNSSTSYTNDPQITLARDALSSSSSPFKFVFYHMPAFYCGNGGMGANGASLAFVDLAVQNNVDAIFNGHSHVYSRTCRMTKNHVCTGTTSGTVQVEVGTVGATEARLRALKTTAQSVTGYDANGVSSTTNYACNTAGGYAATLGSQRTFCYVNVRGCWANVNCYQVGNSSPFDSWTLNHCK